jgi:hypothetical protein
MRNLLTNILFGIILVFGVQSCTKNDNNDLNSNLGTDNDTLISVVTTPVSLITATTATSGGNVEVLASNIKIKERGIIYDTASNLTIVNGKKLIDTTDQLKALFISNITGLSANVKYYVRAYAVTSTNKTYYGKTENFTTTNGSNPPPSGTYSWSFTANGKSYSWSGTTYQNAAGFGGFSNNYQTQDPATRSQTTVPLFIAIGKDTGTPNQAVLAFYINAATKGTYTLSGPNLVPSSGGIFGDGTRNVGSFFNTNTQLGPFAGGSITVSITSITPTQIDGTFSGTINGRSASTGSSENLSVSNGKFTLPYVTQDPPPPPPPPPPAESFSWSYTANGKSYSWAGSTGTNSQGSGYFIKNFSTTNLNGGTENVPLYVGLLQGSQTMILYINGTTTGTYTLSGTNIVPSCFAIIDNSSYFTYGVGGLPPTGSVTVNITSITSNQVSGTFSGTLNGYSQTNASQVTTTITNGKFTVPVSSTPN